MLKPITLEAIKEQIKHYEEFLAIENDEMFHDAMNTNFGGVQNCPVCIERLHMCEELNIYPSTEYKCWTIKDNTTQCPAIVDNVRCIDQSWYERLIEIEAEAFSPARIAEARILISSRLIYWKTVFIAYK